MPSSAGSDVNSRGHEQSADQPLVIAAWFGHLEAMELLIKNGADARSPDPYGRTPLHSSVIMHSEYMPTNPETIRILLRNRADPQAKDKEGRTALDLAKKYRNIRAIDLLEASETELKSATE